MPPLRACQARPRRTEGGSPVPKPQGGEGAALRGAVRGLRPRTFRPRPPPGSAASPSLHASARAAPLEIRRCLPRFTPQLLSAPGWGGAAPAPPSRPTASYRLHGGSPGACDAGHGQRKLWAEAGPPRGAPATAAPGGGGRAGPAHAGPVRRGRAAGQLRRLSS